MNTINIGLADSQSIFLHGLKMILNTYEDTRYKVCWEGQSGKKLLEEIKGLDLDILLMELCLKDIDGIDILTELKKLNPQVRIIIFTQYTQAKFIKDAFLDGVDGYLLKSDTIENLFNAIETVLQGKTFMGDGISIGPKRGTKSPHDKRKWTSKDAFLMKHELTSREKEILYEICTGKSTKEIAQALYISNQTVSVHKKNIMRKFDVNSSKSLKKIALKFNFQETYSPA